MKRLNRFSLILTGLGLVGALLVMVTGSGLTDGSFGPAAYYYTDIPGWQERFHGPQALAVSGSEQILLPALILSILLGAVFLSILLRTSRKRSQH